MIYFSLLNYRDSDRDEDYKCLLKSIKCD